MAKKHKIICPTCKGNKKVWVEKAGHHSSDPGQMNPVRRQEKCKTCNGQGYFIEEVG